ncbi:sugar MFS transporter [Chitinophaga pinensis]|uniref:Glucose/galactose transporter n=1 Tax=Chitinophaga pinensis (strain ATCC 43595 / DSM 2588 / LMG 13176 / NBRC 15968 / NCIMB 11800 / UQM 2034) TaxID=485918 RepID=A0A979GZG2_CHIPD|nr:sugar MFS transporter [Chitinophaga pinensis]ACU63964.1 glucose/galactose transporter [Chitinophaga pinensis DSM 2588]
MSNTATTLAAPKQASYVQSLLILGVLYFMLGFITWVNATLIPFLQLSCQLTIAEALLVTFASYLGYFFLAIPSSFIIKKTGFKNGMAYSLVIIAAGCLIFIPAANTRNFGLFLAGLFIQGMGMSLLQTASNPYVSIIGPIESAAKRISIMGICNKIAGTISPLILASIILKDAEGLEKQIAATTDAVVKSGLLDSLASRVILPYIVLAVILVGLAVAINRSSLPEIDTDNKSVDNEGKTVTDSRNSIFQYPYLLLGALCIFMYVGVEVMAGDVIGTYGRELGMSLDKTKYFTTFTLAAMLVGYVVGIIAIPKYLSQDMSLRICAILGILFTACAFMTSGYVAVTFIALLGLANSLMWPAIFPLAIEKLGSFTKLGSAFLIMGIVGGGILPQIFSRLYNPESFIYVQGMDFRHAFLYCMVPGYLYILYYALAGHKVGKR